MSGADSGEAGQARPALSGSNGSGKLSRRKQTPLRTHLILAAATLIVTTLAGSEWMFGGSFLYGPNPLGWDEFLSGLQYSVPFIGILTFHEFGHYFTAKYNNVKVTLPYYLPVWLGFLGMPSFGTFGAFIRIQERPKSSIQNFDIGIAGPIAGFVVTLAVLWYGFTHLPEKSYLYKVHPEYQVLGPDFDRIVHDQDTFVLKTDVARFNEEYAEIMPDTVWFRASSPSYALGGTLLFKFFERNVVPPNHRDRIPHPKEAYHYPWLFAGFLALVFTALNLLPIGQLDGGHVIYGMYGPKVHAVVSRAFFALFTYYAGLGFINPHDPPPSILGLSGYVMIMPLYLFFLYYCFKGFVSNQITRLTWVVGIFAAQFFTVQFFPTAEGFSGWLLFLLILGRFMGLDYPPAVENTKLDSSRMVLGWLAMIILLLSFSLQPLILTGEF